MFTLGVDFPISRYCCDSENDSWNTIVYDSVAILNDSLKVLISKFFYYNLKNYWTTRECVNAGTDALTVKACKI